MPRTIREINGRQLDPFHWPEPLPFPHNTSEESYVLRKFIEQRILEGTWYFDVKLPSKKASYIDRLEEPWRTMWINLTAKRIDALCITNDSFNIIEVKREMLASGIGQLKLYYKLFIEYYEPDSPVNLWYVCYYHDPDIIEYCKEEGINVWYLV